MGSVKIQHRAKSGWAKRLARVALGSFLIFAGIGHLTFARRAFRAQVPESLPMNTDRVVVWSGYAEILLGLAIIFAGKHKEQVGKFAAAFFTAVFPGNIAQFVNRKSAFGLNSDARRFGRLFFQPVLAYWAIASTKEEKLLD